MKVIPTKDILSLSVIIFVICGCGRSDPWSSKDCGDGLCTGEETVASCPEDCSSKTWQCGNGVCEPGESEAICPADCLGEDEGCGDGACSSGETAANCPSDCHTVESSCGNGTCEAGESVASCPNDCAWLPIFDGQCIGNECVLNDDADTTFAGPEDGRVGSSAAIVDDMDGDDLADIVIGNFRDETNGERAGAVYVVYGRSGGLDRHNRLTDADAIIPGERVDDYFGHSLSSAGDVNGDGLGDFVVGAPSQFHDGPGQGRVYLVTGQTQRLQGTIDIAHSLFGLVRFVDSETVGSAGYTVAGAGDVDGDGRDDILIGAPDRSGTANGAVYLLYSQNWEPNLHNSVWLDDVAGGWLNGLPGSYLGTSLAMSGDWNGDGYAEILLGSPGEGHPDTPEGRVYMVFGRSDRIEEMKSTEDTDVLLISDLDDHPITGADISFVGDLDADGYDDMLIGKLWFDGSEVYLFYGRPQPPGDTIYLEDADAIFEAEMQTKAGPNCVSAGDINGDGFDDMTIGAVYEGKDAVYLFLGGTDRYKGRYRVQDANSVFFVEPDGPDDCSGWAGSVVSGGGDVNGDGVDDFLIGARGHCGRGGYVYLVLGIGGK